MILIIAAVALSLVLIFKEEAVIMKTLVYLDNIKILVRKANC